MKIKALLLFLITIIFISSANAADQFLIVIDGNSPATINALTDFPGRIWGKATDRIYLSGGENEIAWLSDYNINHRLVAIDGDLATLYISHFDYDKYVTDKTFDRGPGYILSDHPIAGANAIRRLTRYRMAPEPDPINSDIILTYSRYIDTLINSVSRDTLISFLNQLSGAAPIQYSGGVDTIRTRYSGTPDNALAARYLKEIFEGYGYQAEYHGFFTGTPRHVASYGPNKAWLVTENSQAHRTTDGGQTWLPMPDNASSELWGVANAGPDSVWLSGNYGALKFSSDGGATFSNQNAASAGFLFGMCFINSRQGWIALDGGGVSRTTNGGAQWTRYSTPVTTRFYDVCFIDSLNGWAVGQNGSIVHTTNGGTVWSRQTSNTSQRLYGVDFTSPYNGWVVGWGGVVLHTTDSGDNWALVNLGDGIEKYHVDFTDSLHGCIDGWEGGIYVTSDGGVNWQQMASGTTNDLYGLSFGNSSIGYAVGNGIILKTTDGGSSWLNQTSGIISASRNVIATKPGSTYPSEQVIICAHLDNTSGQPQTLAPGADDNGSGTIGVIEAARIFENFNFEKTIKFCLWTGEEQGLLGSAAYAADAASRGDTIIGVLNFDMIAWEGNSDDSIDIHAGTMASSQALGALFRDVNTDYNIGLRPQTLTWDALDRSDHASFWDHNYPAILGIEDYSHDFNPYYHTISDNMGIIDSAYFARFVKTAVGATATLAVLDTAGMGVDSDDNLPTGFALHQNYPNPFNAATTISFTIPVKSTVNLSIFDLLGRKVATLIDGQLEAGSHSITWNAPSLASSVYVYRLQAGERKASGRMMLLK